MDFENQFPPFPGFSIKKVLVYHGFRPSRFFITPKIRDEQGLPVLPAKAVGPQPDNVPLRNEV